MKLDEVSAARLRKLRAEGATYKELAKMFKIAKSTVSYVVNRKTWS